MPNSHVATTYVNEVTHIYVLLGSLNPKISFRFSLRPVVFELYAILRQVHWIYKVKGTPYVLLISTSPKYDSFLLYHQLLFSYLLFL